MSFTFLHLNVWSGSTYELDYLKGSFRYYESPERREQRYRNLVREIRRLQPDVITLNEVMPCRVFLDRLLRDLSPNYDGFCHVGVAGVNLCGVIRYPCVDEGDAILAKRGLNLRWVGRERLTGQVYADNCAFNFDDATQVIGATIEFNKSTKVVILCTHWQASVIDDAETHEDLERLRVSGRFSSEEIAKGRTAIERGSAVRKSEARGVVRFLNSIVGDEIGTPRELGCAQTVLSCLKDFLPCSSCISETRTATRINDPLAIPTTATFEDREVSKSESYPPDLPFHVILAGDLNTVSGTPEMRELFAYAGEKFAFQRADDFQYEETAPRSHVEQNIGTQIRSAANPDRTSSDCLPPPCTWDPILNENVRLQKEKAAYPAGRQGNPVEEALFENFSMRRAMLDHILFCRNRSSADGNHMRICETRNIVMCGRSDSSPCDSIPPSDHYGLFVKFEIVE